jgi:hypothetical protein
MDGGEKRLTLFSINNIIVHVRSQQLVDEKKTNPCVGGRVNHEKN